MKKTLLTLALAGLFLTLDSCKKNESSETKIDFTKSYEDAALALASAQKKYDEALASNDPEKIAAAKKELEVAQAKYVESKGVYIANGGTAKQEYEDYLTTSTKTLETNAQKTDSLTSSIKTVVEENKTEISEKVTSEKAKLKAASEKVQSDVKSTVSKAKTDVNTAIEKTKTDVTQKSDAVKKSTDEKITKAKQDLNSLLNK